jgi:hypothetical protein
MKMFALLACLVCPVTAQAADICRAIALRDVPALESPSSILAKGSFDTAITQYRVNKQTHEASFCSHGGYCYPTHIFVGARKIEALRLVNCRVGKRSSYSDPDEIFYEIDVDRSKNSASTLRYDDLDNKLLNMGLCSACASSAAEHYLKKPNSACGQLVKRALEGNPASTKRLMDFPDFCN